MNDHTRYLRYLLALIFIGLTGCQTLSVDDSDPFFKSVNLTSEKYNQYDKEKYQSLLYSGEFEQASQLIENQTKEKKGIDHFVLGNIFFQSDFERSFRYHSMAFESLPSHPSIQLQMAIHYHRRNQCNKALPIYQSLIRQGQLKEYQNALVAHCYLLAKMPNESLTFWKKANATENGSKIDALIFSIYGQPHPFYRYSKIIQQIKKGDISKIPNLIDLTLAWDEDWWHISKNETAYRFVKMFLLNELKSDLINHQEYQIMFQAMHTDNHNDLKQILQTTQLILNNGTLPKNSYVAKRIILKSVQLGVVDEHFLYKRHFQELSQRAFQDNDKNALEIAAHILVKTKRTSLLAPFDKKGWQDFGDINFAKSEFIGLQIKHRINHNHPIFEQFKSLFPDDPYFFIQYYFEAKKQGLQSTSMLTDIIRSEFSGLKSHPLRSSRNLDNYYQRLQATLENTKKVL